jgi:hypothetical protein
MFHGSILSFRRLRRLSALRLPENAVAFGEIGSEHLRGNWTCGSSAAAPMFDNDCNHQLRTIERSPADKPRMVP